MELPARNGRWHTRTVLMTVAMASYDNQEKNKVTGARDGYKNMWMLCSMYGAHCSQTLSVLLTNLVCSQTEFVCRCETPSHRAPPFAAGYFSSYMLTASDRGYTRTLRDHSACVAR